MGDRLRYLIFQKEICPETEREHFQGFLYSENPIGMQGAKNAIGDQIAHFEPMRGSIQQAIDYCKKPETRVPGSTWEEEGEPPEQGRRTDLHDFRDAVLGGVDDSTLVQDHIGCLAKYPRLESRLKAARDKELTRSFRSITVVVNWGDTGTGKTRGPYEEGAFIWHPSSPEWWDGYDGEEMILIDEFYGQLKPDRLLALLDGYQCRLPVKGAFTYAKWTKVYITSNQKPEDWYGEAVPDSVKAALMRRISQVVHFSLPFGPV